MDGGAGARVAGMVLEVRGRRAVVLADGRFLRLRAVQGWEPGQDVWIQPLSLLAAERVRRAVLAAAAAAGTVAVVLTGGAVAAAVPVAVVSVDVNPSVQLAVNHWARVVGVMPMDPEGVRLVAQAAGVDHLPVGTAVADLVADAIRLGYVPLHGGPVTAATARRGAAVGTGRRADSVGGQGAAQAPRAGTAMPRASQVGGQRARLRGARAGGSSAVRQARSGDAAPISAQARGGSAQGSAGRAVVQGAGAPAARPAAVSHAGGDSGVVPRTATRAASAVPSGGQAGTAASTGGRRAGTADHVARAGAKVKTPRGDVASTRVPRRTGVVPEAVLIAVAPLRGAGSAVSPALQRQVASAARRVRGLLRRGHIGEAVVAVGHGRAADVRAAQRDHVTLGEYMLARDLRTSGVRVNVGTFQGQPLNRALAGAGVPPQALPRALRVVGGKPPSGPLPRAVLPARAAPPIRVGPGEGQPRQGQPRQGLPRKGPLPAPPVVTPAATAHRPSSGLGGKPRQAVRRSPGRPGRGVLPGVAKAIDRPGQAGRSVVGGVSTERGGRGRGAARRSPGSASRDSPAGRAPVQGSGSGRRREGAGDRPAAPKARALVAAAHGLGVAPRATKGQGTNGGSPRPVPGDLRRPSVAQATVPVVPVRRGAPPPEAVRSPSSPGGGLAPVPRRRPPGVAHVAAPPTAHPLRVGAAHLRAWLRPLTVPLLRHARRSPAGSHPSGEGPVAGQSAVRGRAGSAPGRAVARSARPGGAAHHGGGKAR